MTTETTTHLPPEAVLRAVKRFFLGEDALHSAWLERESETHLGFGTFRGNIAVAAFPDPEREGRTRVRVSTLREEHAVPRLMTYLRTLDAGERTEETDAADRPEGADAVERPREGARA